jgi:cytoskeletal protein RodZ
MDSIGEYLRTAREERKIPIAQIARDTKINERYLMAMESGDFTVMPATPYIKGFVKIYAEYLGLDPRPLLEQLAQDQTDVSKSAYPVEVEAAASAIPWKKIMLGIAAVAVIAAVGHSFLNIVRSCEGKHKRRIETSSEELETLPIPVVPTLRPTTALLEATPAVIEEPRKKLTARAKETVWMKVYADGALLFQGTIRKGKEESWTARETFDLRIGKPRSIELALDGKVIKDFNSKEAQNLLIDKDRKMIFYKGKMKAE